MGEARRMRKQPLRSIASETLGSEHSPAGTSQSLLRALTQSPSERKAFFEKLWKELVDFLAKADEDWPSDLAKSVNDSDRCRRFTVFGESITCAWWQDRGVVSGSDIVKAIGALYRLSHMGRTLKDRKRLEEGIFSDLRSMRCDTDYVLEAANSNLLKFLYRSNAVRTHKRQKVYMWSAVPFMTLYHETVRRFDGTTILMQSMVNSIRNSNSHDEAGALLSLQDSDSSDGSPKSWGSHDEWESMPCCSCEGESKMGMKRLALLAEVLFLEDEKQNKQKLGSARCK